jgi:DNA-binding CsgD family transcriptional regulator
MRINRRRVAAARRAYAALPPAHRRVLALRYVGDLTDAEIAARLGASPEAVADLVAAARAGLLHRPRPRVGRPALAVASLAAAAVSVAPSVHLPLPSSPASVPPPAAAGPRTGRLDGAGAPVPVAAVATVPGTRTVVAVSDPTVSDAANTPSHGRCTVCLPPGTPGPDKVALDLSAAGQGDMEIPVDAVPLCRTLPASIPNEAVRCVPGQA